ncbi:CapA family protein [Kineosporia sp. J2-2]|uniref:CapA family protein n=1 Tax=Kineosporia corallincola TaxID=2835133 RepID=A0ABS5TR53_9ACTN|nr:CapA family protein [Kineosporia corallincola]MBT0773098.1 CapA family protein [Kineosporia corallincola]
MDDAGTAPRASSSTGSSALTTPPTTPAPSPTPESEQFTLVATGDVLLHESLWAQARADAEDTGRGVMDFRPMLAGVKPYVRDADVALCHLETPLAPAGGPYSAYPSFSGPPQIAKALASTGYDVCSTASNHTFDQGAAGVDRTLDGLDEAGVEHAGSARSARESKRITMLDVNGVKVAFLSYTYGFNGVAYPGGQTWRANEISQQGILDDATRARGAGAEVVVAAMHWGTEYSQTPSAQQEQLAPRLARSGKLDLIISHHAHVVEPVQKISRTWVVYGLGNLVADHSTPGDPNAEGLLTRFTFTRAGGAKRFTVSQAEYVPLLMTKQTPHRVLDVREALRTKDYGSTTRSRLQEALRRTTRVVESMGGRKKGLTQAAP